MKSFHTKALGLLGIACLVVTTGCLQSDVTETWYVDANGAVTWLVEERDVRSDAQNVVDRNNEENEYWLAVQQERHPMAQGLQAVGGEKLKTTALRSAAPFTVLTQAKFTGLDALGQRLIAAIGGTGTSIIRRDQGMVEWTLTVRDPSAIGGSTEPADGLSDLMDGLNHLKVVLISGRFESTEGFTLSGDRRVARYNPEAFEASGSGQPAVTLKLTWK